ncbi:hypothetical protein [Flavobacterium subsaxonicum]|uniref:DUF4468 domain-containing protein n=1 Tax=Flavobacterium subsaxonicum WB 4.1-42 = DSM 21790 TaxID=1121898 RepID=A0A0A2MK93_9FLAO|nr:hypothetical protein [Flavobacterium subsaxonicum]KGO93062.1 hypothetical protein Q766_10640 [Flavobacterium subsaxonicum WB 4.1-42 = DSM 21790]
MLKLYTFVCVLVGVAALAQPPRMELEPNGFAPVQVTIPSIPNEKLVEITKAWAAEYNKYGQRNNRGFDATDVTNNTITISAFKKNAFYYRDRGEAFEHKINYSMKIVFSQNSYSVTFTVNKIFTDSDVELEYNIPNYFTSAGKLKEGYLELDTSLETTVNDIVNSHYNFIVNYK